MDYGLIRGIILVINPMNTIGFIASVRIAKLYRNVKIHLDILGRVDFKCEMHTDFGAIVGRASDDTKLHQLELYRENTTALRRTVMGCLLS